MPGDWCESAVRLAKPERTILIGHAGEAHARRRGVQKTILKNQTLD
jgi:hypothetical protein